MRDNDFAALPFSVRQAIRRKCAVAPKKGGGM
jgi:hypothetical protein